MTGHLRFVVGLVLGTACLSATQQTTDSQTATPPESPIGSQILRTIQDAEAEGVVYPQGPLTGGVNDFRDVTGTSDRRCVETANNHDVRSGEFVAGPFDLYPKIWHEGHAKLYWMPLYVPAKWPTTSDAFQLRVRASPIGPNSAPQTYRLVNWARTVGPDPALFFPSRTRLPSVGRWLLVATAGPNWGCFVFDLK